MALEQKGRRLAAALEARHQVGPPSRIFVSSAGHAGFVEHALDQVDGDELLAWRVGGVEPDEIAGKTDDESLIGHSGTLPLADRRLLQAPVD